MPAVERRQKVGLDLGIESFLHRLPAPPSKQDGWLRMIDELDERFSQGRRISGRHDHA